MKDLIDNIKNLIPVIVGIVALAGFYYTTQHRLDHLESEIKELKNQNKRIKKSISKNK